MQVRDLPRRLPRPRERPQSGACAPKTDGQLSLVNGITLVGHGHSQGRHRDRLADPNAALLDLEDCHDVLPPWLRRPAAERLERCREQAPKSRKRAPSVKPRPLFTGFDHMLDAVAPAVVERQDGEQPGLWTQIAPYFFA